jgi:hypothetical protein
MYENEDEKYKVIEVETLNIKRISEDERHLSNKEDPYDEEKLTIFRSNLNNKEKSKKKQSRVSFEENDKKRLDTSNLQNDETHKINSRNSHTNMNNSIKIKTNLPQSIIYYNENKEDEDYYMDLVRDTSPLKQLQIDTSPNREVQRTESPMKDLWQINDKIGLDNLTIEPKIGRNQTKGSNSTSSPMKNWKKLQNLFRSLNSFHKYETKNINDETEFDIDLKDYKTRLFDNTIKVRKSTLDESKKSLFDSKLIKILEDDKFNINFKEEIHKLIVNGDTTAVKKIDALIKKDPAYYLNDITDPNFKLNTPLGNGKTLIYIACQEGKIEVVKYLLEKKLNPFVMSKFDGNELESPLGVASRWNFINIVELLLKNVKYEKNHIEQVLIINGLTKKVRKILKMYYKDKFNINKCCG